MRANNTMDWPFIKHLIKMKFSFCIAYTYHGYNPTRVYPV